MCKYKSMEGLTKHRPTAGWGIDVWFLIAAIMSGYKIDEVFLGKKDHSSFNEYKEDV